MIIRLLTMLALIATPVLATAQRAYNSRAVQLRYLDRTTGEQGDVDLLIGQKANLGTLEVIVEECRYPAGAISSDAFAFLSIQEPDLQKDWFGGWMVASSPALNALEHPRYDIWVLRCKTS
ncbi:MAG: DUF2155 domain-containing protein [Planktomarina sp.]